MNTTTLDEQGLQEFSKADAVVAKLQPYMELKVSGIDDADGIKRVHDARMEVRRCRIDLEKSRKDLKADALEFGRRVDAEAKRIKSMLEPIENHLHNEESIVKREQERLAKIAEQEQAERLERRMKALADVQAMMDPKIIELLDEDQWLDVLAQRTMEYEQRVQAAADERAELERLRAEQQAEEKRAAEKRAAEESRLAVERELIAAEQARLQAERDRIEAEAAEAERKKQMEIAAEKRKQREAEAEVRRQAMAPDVEKLRYYANRLGEIRPPEVSTAVATEVLRQADSKLRDVCGLLRSGCDNLA